MSAVSILLEGKACKELSYAYSQGEVAVEIHDGKIVVGGRDIPVVDSKWADYRQFYDEAQANAAAMLIVARKGKEYETGGHPQAPGGASPLHLI